MVVNEMKKENFVIGSTPALLIGEQNNKVFLFVHGLHGHKEEALAFAEVAEQKVYQVLGVDLPLERKPWEVFPLLNEVREYLYKNWKSVSLRANSIGSWFSLLSFQGKKVEQSLFVSPLLDMKKFIEEQLTREEDYYGWVVNNPVAHWDAPTYILRPEVDQIVSENVGSAGIEVSTSVYTTLTSVKPHVPPMAAETAPVLATVTTTFEPFASAVAFVHVLLANASA